MSWGNTNSTVTLTFVLWSYGVLNRSNLKFSKLLGWDTYSYNMKFMSNPCLSSFLLEFFWSWFPGVVLVSNVTLSSSLFLVIWGGKGCALCSPVHLKIEQERAALFCSSRPIQHMDTGLSEVRLFCALIGAEGGSVNKKACLDFIKITPRKMKSKGRTVKKSRTECGTRAREEAVVCTAASNVSSKGPYRKKKGSDPSLKGPLQRSCDVGSTVHPKIAQVGSCAESRQKNARVHPLRKYKTHVFSF